jgi:FkbM family methyltransferase
MSTASILDKVRSIFQMHPNEVFKHIKGVIHVGANIGQERELYRKNGLQVVWVEPIPDIYATLKSNIAGFPGQIALQGLLTDKDDVTYQFHVASNNGESSSILEFSLHKELWPGIEYQQTIDIQSRTLPVLLKENHIDQLNYDMLVIDTQGSELLVLQGALPILRNFTYVKIEVPDFESYKGCCKLEDLQLFMNQHGFKEYARSRFAGKRGSGNYYDIIYKKIER